MSRDRLLEYYNRELVYIRKLAWEFAERYPDRAANLMLEQNKCDDPHVERLIQSFALLTSRIRLRLDDDFPQLSDSFLSVLYPHWLRPIPSSTILQFGVDGDWSTEGEGLKLPRHSPVLTRPVEGFRCEFRTTLDLELFPVAVESVEAVALRAGEPLAGDCRGGVRIVLKTMDGRAFRSVGYRSFDFFCDGDPALANGLYELLFRAPRGIRVSAGRAGGQMRRLPASNLVPVGFEENEGLVPYPPASNLGYRLLAEYFAFPEKFRFGRIEGLAEAADTDSDTLELVVLLDEFPLRYQSKLTPENLRPGCTPAVNLFRKECDPIRLTQTEIETQVIPDVHVRDGFEVHTIEEVVTTSQQSGASRTYRPFYALKHGETPDKAAFWHADRRPSNRDGDDGSELWISLVDRRQRPVEREPGEVLHVTALCTNRDLPARLPIGPEGDFRVEGQPALRRIRCLRKPTAVIRPEAGDGGRWKVVSHLSLNFLSLTDRAANPDFDSDLSSVVSGSPGLDAFRELLKLYDFTDSSVARQRISGVIGIESRPVVRRIRAGKVSVPARGLEVTVQFDEERFADGGVFLFASVLERFLGLYASMNSFVRTVATVRQREGVLKGWNPRAGSRSLL